MPTLARLSASAEPLSFIPIFGLPFERPLASVGDPDANDLDRLAASPDGLALFGCESGVDKAGQHSTCESVGEQQGFGKAALVDGEQL